MAFLLANLALAGALHFLSPAKPAASVAESETAKSTDNEVNEAIPNTSVSTPAAVASESAPDSLDRLRQWAKRDPGEAWNWVLKQPDGDHRVEMLEAVCFQIAEDGDPARAVALADNLHLTGHGTLANLEQQWAQTDLPAAREWAIAKPAGDEKNELLERVGFVWSASQPSAAADFVVQEMTPGPAQTEAAISVLHQWALRDFDGAKAWVELFPDGEIRERAVNELAGVQEYSQQQGQSRGDSSSSR